MGAEKTTPAPGAKIAGAGLSGGMEVPLDRRKHKRYGVKEGALVSPVTKERKYWKMLNVSMGGASFRYIPDERMGSFEEIDIVMQNLDFALEGVPFKLIWECELKNGLSHFPILRRCGVEFPFLTRLQESHLEEFIRKYTAPVS